MRRLANLVLLLLAILVFAIALLFVLGNPEPVSLELLITDWQPTAGAGAMLTGFLLTGLLLGVVLGLMMAGLFRRRQRGERP